MEEKLILDVGGEMVVFPPYLGWKVEIKKSPWWYQNCGSAEHPGQILGFYNAWCML